jgi:dihydroflavonol-4-reductase
MATVSFQGRRLPLEPQMAAVARSGLRATRRSPLGTAFVTGATGCLGINLVGELLSAGWHVVAMHRATSRLDDLAALPVDRVVGDVTDLGALVRAMPAGVDVVFNVAGDTSLWARNDERKRRVHVDGARNVVEAAIRQGAKRLVHTSSAGAYGEHLGMVSEETPSTAATSPVSSFRTKWEGEQEVRRGLERGLDAVIMEPALITGPHDRHASSRFFRMVRDGKLPLAPPGRNSWAHAREVARAHVAAARLGRRGEAFILGGADASWVEVLGIIGQLVGRPGPRRTMPRWALRGLASVMQLASRVTGREPDVTPEGAAILSSEALYDCSKAVRELGYRPVPLREILEDCHRWMIAAGL